MDKDFTSLFYIYNPESKEDFSRFSKHNGFVLQKSDDFLKACDKIKSKQPDLIIIDSEIKTAQTFDKNINELFKIEFKYQPAIFLILPEYPKSEKRLELLYQGYDDFLVTPFSNREVKEKAKVYHKLKNSNQKIFTQNIKIKKAFEYLDKFKHDLKQTKTELYDERIMLNNVLKQVNQMTDERTRLKKEIKKIKKTLLDNIEGFGDILSSLIKAGVEKNRGHGERVAHIAEFIARQLKLDEKKIEDIRKAAILHEVGLLFVPEEILRKEKDQQTDYEKDLFIQYPFKGADLISSCTKFEKCAKIIRHLNENSDGTGSPQGLKRRYIPLESRILTGADVFDTLKDEKDISSLENFLETLEIFSGTRLDPAIVACLEKYAVLHMGSASYQVKGVGIHQLESGMTLGTALFTNTGTKLFSSNTLLTQDAIDKIKRYNKEYPVDETVYIRT